ncbi:MAG: hypothetical protein JWP27_191 [Flaviaesturariibacter sp.]|nr:hypothetical protein [Flaviaesturariibacter sp.]
MRIIALSGSPAAIPALNHLFMSDMLAALICPAADVSSEVAPLEVWAAGKGVPCWRVEQAGLETELTELIAETSPDLLLVYGFPYAVPAHLPESFVYGAWNVQFTLQPDHQGSVTIHQLAGSGADAPILQQSGLALLSSDYGGTPINQLSLVSVVMIQAALRTLNLPEPRPHRRFGASGFAVAS